MSERHSPRVIDRITATLSLFEWRLVLGGWVMVTAVSAYEIVPASVLPVLMADLGIRQSAAGTVISASIAAQAVVAIPVGIFLNRFRTRSLVGGATALFVVAGVGGYVAAVEGRYWLLLQSRAAGGLASVCIWTAYLELVRRHVTVRTRATTLGLFTAGIPAGFVVGQLSGPLVADLLSWEWIFAVFTVPTIVGYLLFKLLAPDWSAPASGESASTPKLGDFTQVLSNGAVWSICLMGFVSTSVFLFFNSWMPTYLTETFGVSLAQSGAFVALFPLIGLVGRTSSGVLSGTVFGARRRPITRLSFLGSVLSMVLVVAVSTSLVVVPLALAAGFCMQVAMGIYFTYVSETADPVVATTALSLLTFSGLMGAASAPVVTGVLIERFGTYVAAFSFVAALLFVGLVLAWRTPESNPGGA